MLHQRKQGGLKPAKQSVPKLDELDARSKEETSIYLILILTPFIVCQPSLSVNLIKK